MKTLLVPCAALGMLSAAMAADTTVTLATEGGTIQGLTRDGVAIFMGVPYAGSPAADNRWRPAPPVEPWEGVRDATKRGPVCMQENRYGAAGPDAVYSEDCLNLNIWTTAFDSGERHPVMVWIHGGSYRWGAGSQVAFDGSALAKKGVVVVTINYRLDRFGVFAHPALSRLDEGKPRANYNLLDQVAALEWVQRNIAAFGGNPDSVTIFGQSAGGGSVNYLLVAPAAEGLFHRAISMSGGVRIGDMRHISERRGFEPPLEEDGLAFAAWAGIDTAASDDDIVAELRALPAEKFLEYSKQEAGGALGPVVDGVFIPEPIGRLFRDGRQHTVPYLAGATNYEQSLLDYFDLEVEDIIRDATVDEARAAYPGLDDKTLAKTWFRDTLFVAPTQYLVAAMSRTGAPTYLYHFTLVAEGSRVRPPGARHGGDVPFVFAVSDPVVGIELTDADRAKSEIVQNYFVRFAKSGDPNGGDAPEWPRYDLAAPALLELGEEVARRDSPFAEVMALHFARFARQMGEGR